MLVHMFDELAVSLEQPWRPALGVDDWRYVYSDRMSFSLINKQLPFFYNLKYRAGFVASPQKADLLCSWFIDYGTMDKQCTPPCVHSDCMPGCWVGKPNWCSGRPGAPVWDCSFPRNLTKLMLESDADRLGLGRRRLGAAYNELILSWHSLVRDLPTSIEAFVFTEWGAIEQARAARRNFLQEFPGSKPPLMLMNVEDPEAVFTIMHE